MKKFAKKMAWVMIFTLLFQSFAPTTIYAITSGPSQPEYSHFNTVSFDDLVDPATGDFSYSIPLLEVGAPGGSFPLNLSYSNPINSDQEASMVGLGWSLNLPAINRDVVGYPDDFNKVPIKQLSKRPKVYNYSISLGVEPEVIGLKGDKLGLNLTGDVILEYNSESGIGYRIGNKIGLKHSKNGPFSMGIGVNSGNMVETSYSPYFDYDLSKYKGKRAGLIKAFKPSITSIANDLVNGRIDNNLSNISFNMANSSYSISTYNSIMAGGQAVWANVSEKIGFGESVSTIYNNGQWVNRKVIGNYYHDDSFSNEFSLDYYRMFNSTLSDNSESGSVSIPSPDNYTISTGNRIKKAKIHHDQIQILSKELEVEDNYFSETGIQIDLPELIEKGISLGGDLSRIKTHANSSNAIENLDYLPKKNYSNSSVPKKSFIIDLPNYRNENLDLDDRYPKFLSFLEENPFKSTIFKTDAINSGYSPSGNSINHLQSREQPLVKTSVLTPFLNKEIKSGIHPFFNVKYCNQGVDNNEVLSYAQMVNRNYGVDKFSGFALQDIDSKKYYYTLPVINKIKIDASFDVPDQDNCTNTLDYKSVPDNAYDVLTFEDEFKEIIQTPAYAETFLLTAIVGEDYIDIDPNDGLPNSKDVGYWIRFDYITDPVNEYKWRSPFIGATVSKGVNYDKGDAIAQFTAGIRENYYIKQITSSTHQATFTYSKRKDNKGAKYLIRNEGFDSDSYTYKLDELILRRLDSEELVKKVNFTYHESNLLCPGIPNSEDGAKLTLKSVQINNHDFQEVDDGFFPPYTFEYNPTNPSYNPFKKDRWGVQIEGDAIACNQEFNPTPQDLSIEMHQNWHLRKITLPSGSEIQIDVSRDHYAYDEFQKAGQYYKLEGINEVGLNELSGDKRLLFKLPDNVSIDDCINELYQDENGRQLYFNVKADIASFLGEGTYESIQGFAYIDSYNETIINNQRYGWVSLKNININPLYPSINPITGLVWQKLRSDFRTEMYGGILGPSWNKNQILEKLGNEGIKLVTSMLDHYSKCEFEKRGQFLQLENSYIRLLNGNNLKYGGDFKVDRVRYYDATEQVNYGKVYNYGHKEGDRYKSHGVVNSEPISGMFESSKLFGVNVEKKLKYFFGEESFETFPSASFINRTPKVIYSKVEVLTLASDYMNKKYESSNDPNIQIPDYYNSLYPDMISSTGSIIYEHYTAKDYPTLQEHIFLKPIKQHPFYLPILLVLLKFKCRGFSQGLNVEFNDMHGKLKSIKTFQQSKSGEISSTPISILENSYRDKKEIFWFGDRAITYKRLDNRIEDNLYKSLIMNSVEIQNTEGYSGGGDVNFDLDISSAGIYPLPLPVAWLFANIQYTNLGYASFYKEVHTSGILEKIKNDEYNKKQITENVLWDINSGSPKLTITNNEYTEGDSDKNTFSLKSFSRENYSLKDGCYLNAGFENNLTKSNINFTPNCLGDFSMVDSENLFQVGDRFFLDDIVDPEQYQQACIPHQGMFVITNKKEDGLLFFEQLTGDNLDDFCEFLNVRIVESGYQNQPYGTGSELVGLNYNIQNNNHSNKLLSYAFNKEEPSLNYYLGSNCEFEFQKERYYQPKIPFLFNGNRSYTNVIHEEKGILEDFVEPNYNNISFGFLDNQWFSSGIIELKNSYSQPIQSVSQAGIRSSVLYDSNLQRALPNPNGENNELSYKNEFPIAIAQNALHSEIICENFESMNADKCVSNTHFPFGVPNEKLMESYQVIDYDGNSQVVLNLDSKDFHFKEPSKIHVFMSKSSGEEVYFESDFSGWSTSTTSSLPTRELVEVSLQDPCNARLNQPNVIKLFFEYEVNDGSAISNTRSNKSHTGNHSLKLTNGADININSVNLKDQKKYMINLWVKSDDENLQLSISSNGNVFNLMPSTKKIDGWQRFSGSFNYSNNAILSILGLGNIFIDDFRLQPINSEMNSYVYNDLNQIIYMLDENNFYTQYHYDGYNNLVAISKETVNGKRTISTSRKSIKTN